MRTLRKSIGAVAVGIVTVLAAGGSARDARPDSFEFTPDRSSLPVAMVPRAQSAQGSAGAVSLRARDRLVVRARLARPPTSDSGFGCPIERTRVSATQPGDQHAHEPIL
jgi:hypothetical protein